MKFTIFCERVWDFETFIELKNFIKKKGAKNCYLYCLSAANYPLMVSEQGYQGTKEEYSKILEARYKELQEECKVQLHLHLSLRPEKMDQESLFKEACEWMRSRGFECKEVMYGWYLSSEQSREMEKKYNLKYTLNKGTYQIHDYEIGPGIWGPIMILQNLRHFLRK